MSGLGGLFGRETALMPYMMAGIPGLGDTGALFSAMAEAGADAFEIGIPYADPLMDGPVIQEAGSRSLANGMTLERGLEAAGEVVAATGVPSVVMTYVNPVLCVGPDRFAARAAEAGVSGVIVADLPVDEAAPIQEAVEQAGLGMVLFAAPTTSDERLDKLAAAGPSFIYGVADLGVTGERSEDGGRAVRLVERIRERTDIPVVLGVGISTPDQARAAAAVADGVIVGSALVRRVLESEDGESAAAALRTAVTDLRTAVA